MGGRIPSVLERKEIFTILANVQAREHQHSMHKMHLLQKIHERRMCQYSSTPTLPAFGNRSMRFRNYISSGSKISSQMPSQGMCFNSKSIARRSSSFPHAVYEGFVEQGTNSQSKLLSNRQSLKKGGMIYCSSMEGFSSPLNNGMFILGIEGSEIFKELDLRLRFTPMICFVLVKISEIWVQERRQERNEKNREKEAIPFPFILKAITLFPLKKDVQK